MCKPTSGRSYGTISTTPLVRLFSCRAVQTATTTSAAKLISPEFARIESLAYPYCDSARLPIFCLTSSLIPSSPPAASRSLFFSPFLISSQRSDLRHDRQIRVSCNCVEQTARYCTTPTHPSSGAPELSVDCCKARDCIMAGVAAYKASIQGQIPSNHAEVLECMDKIEWDTFYKFTCLGSLASMIPFVDDADVKSSLEKLGRITARLKGYRTDRLPSLYAYLALSVSDRTKDGDISGQELHDFYKQVFHSTLREDNMHNFFRQHATVMIVRRFYYRQKSFRLEIVGALTFSRPTDRVPTYLAYVAVSSGRHNYPSLHQTVSQIIPANCFPEGEDLTGFRGRGLGSLLICLM